MKSTGLFSIAVTILLFSTFTSKAQIQTPRYVSVGGNCGGYYEYLPQNYNSTSQNYPLIIAIHGIGELGNGTTDLSRVLNAWVALPRRIENGGFPTSFTVGGQSFSFLVISPQFRSWPSGTDVNQVIDYAIQNYRVDQSRIYVTGLSMGGGATWDFAGTFPNKAAAVVPVCGAASADDTRAKAIASSKLGVWATHNQDDGIVSSANTYGWVNLLTQYNADIRSTIFPVGGHDAWTQTYDPNFTQNGLNIYQWMLMHQRGAGTTPPPANQAPSANAGTDQSITLPQSTATVSGSGSDADGTISFYQWTQVSGPSQAAIASAYSAQTAVNGLVQGSYVLRLTVTDNNGATASDDITITVNRAPNKVPLVNAGQDQTVTLPQDYIVLSGLSKDLDGIIGSYQWSQVSGPSKAGLSNATEPVTTVNRLVEGTYVFHFSATDNEGASATDVITILVKPDPRRPSTAILYPNPARNYIMVQIDAATTRNVTLLKIMNSAGTVVHSEEFVRTSSRWVKQVDIQKLPRGAYFLTVTTDINTNTSLPFIKQ